MLKHFKSNKAKSLSAKIRDLILLITVASLLIIIFFSYEMSRMSSLNKQQKTAYSSVSNAAYILDSYENNLIEQFVNICGTEDFAYNVKLILNEPANDILHTRNLQNVLNDLRFANYLVNSSLIVTGDGQKAYTLFSTPLLMSPDRLFPGSELENVHDISWLAGRSSPFKTNETVIPIVIPLKMVGSYLQIVVENEISPDLYVVFLIDRIRLLNTLNASNPQSDVTDIYLLARNGAAITDAIQGADYEFQNHISIPIMTAVFNKYIYEKGSHLYEAVEDTGIKKRIMENSTISTIERKGAVHHILQYQDSSQYIILHELTRPGIYILGHTEFPGLISFVMDFYPTFIPIFLVLSSILLAVSIFMSSYITKPLLKLVSIVNKIGRNEYSEKATFDTDDEVGTLLKAINQMYDINLKQMQKIREDEKEKYKSELKILSEQINPHFLYNTLEEIQSEVIREKKDTASAMIQHLADYLRIGLSGGADQIAISSEIRHASAYISIMNQRFGQHIRFVYMIEPVLTDKSILKTVLQPLIENSIRHGFGIESNGIPVSVPTIEVNFTSPDMQSIHIEVSDNGCGFDENEVIKIMTKPAHPGMRSHVGINNTWLRLISFYGAENIDIQVESMPYYKNSFFITVKNAL